MKKYELLIVAKDESSYEATKEKFFKRYGVTIEKQDIWGTRRLAYPIKKSETGYYVVLNVALQKDRVVELSRQLELEDDILRSLLFVLD